MAQSSSPKGGDHDRQALGLSNQAGVQPRGEEKKPRVPVPMKVTAFYFVRSVNEDLSPKEVIKDASFPEDNPKLQFSVLLAGNEWPNCFFVHIYRGDTSLGPIHHCHAPLQKELQEGIAYIATKPVSLLHLKPSDDYRAELFADQRLLGVYPFRVMASSSAK